MRHADAAAGKLGLEAGPLEGPTHFSHFVPLRDDLWGDAWFERGCLSVHVQNMCVEGEQVRALADVEPEARVSARERRSRVPARARVRGATFGRIAQDPLKVRDPVLGHREPLEPESGDAQIHPGPAQTCRPGAEVEVA